MQHMPMSGFVKGVCSEVDKMPAWCILFIVDKKAVATPGKLVVS